MNAEQLLQNFDRIAESPGSIAHLRRFILDLAVRGKLVEQDPHDEPASELLKRIQVEKVRLEEEGKIKKQKSLPILEKTEIPFNVPANWVWQRLGNIGDWGSGSTPPRGNREYYDGDINWLKSGELGDCLSLKGSEEKISNIALQKCSFRLNQPGDVLIAMYGATIGKLAILGESAVTNQAVCGCTSFDGVFNRYLFLYLLSRRKDFHDQSEGGAQPNISKIKIVLSPIPIPPLVEQHRIVAKVDELMGLCDRLEAAQKDRESQRDRLVASSLHHLNQATEKAEFRDRAQFYFNNLPKLTTRSEHIKQLRQTILNLAVCGKLVPQDPNDEPASELLKRIQVEKKRLIKEGKIKPEKEISSIDGLAQSFEIPKGWKWIRWNTIALKIGDIDHKMPGTVKDGIPYVSPRDFLPDNQINFDGAKRISLDDFVRLSAKIKPDIGDLIYPRYGTIGENRLVVEQRDFLASYSCAVVKVLKGFINPRFQYFFSVSPYCRQQARAAENKTTQANVGIKSIQDFIFPLPPLAEQHRIVEKVDELMGLCDRLEAQISITETDSHRLLESLLHQSRSVA
jgi:type I restriction enzyme, S subunit